MKIGYVLRGSTFLANDGIRQQALIWGKALQQAGNEVKFISPWDFVDISSLDIIHVFGNGLWLIATIKALQLFRKPIILSPIIDTYQPLWVYKVASYFGCPLLKLYSPNYALRHIRKYLAHVIVRSNHELKYVKVYGLKNENISVLRLPSRMYCEDLEGYLSEKEDFCFHISAFTQPRKNVLRLIKAAIKYKFNLIIAGTPGSEEENSKFYELANEHNNVTILGNISDMQLIEYYRKAKVFALPSIDEGVGFVALEAATFGCNIVITNIGGPKEYYKGQAIEVNPFSIDDIGLGIKKALLTPNNMRLSKFIKENYSIENNTSELLSIYRSCI